MNNEVANAVIMNQSNQVMMRSEEQAQVLDGGVGVAVKVTLPCQQNMVGRVIGRQGETIRALQQASQARIVVNQDFPEGFAREVQLSGTQDAVERASNMVKELTEGNSNSVQSVIIKHGIGQTYVLECPKSVVGRVIGKGGETIKSLQRETGVIAHIDQTLQPCKITIAGTPANVQKAIQQLNTLMYYSSIPPNSSSYQTIAYQAHAPNPGNQDGCPGNGGVQVVFPPSQCAQAGNSGCVYGGEVSSTATAAQVPSSFPPYYQQQPQPEPQPGVQQAPFPVFQQQQQAPPDPSFRQPQYPILNPDHKHQPQAPPEPTLNTQSGAFLNPLMPASQSSGYVGQAVIQSAEMPAGVAPQYPDPHLYPYPYPIPYPQTQPIPNQPVQGTPYPICQVVALPCITQIGIWQKVFDPKNNQTYYYNITTGVSQWDKPPELDF